MLLEKKTKLAYNINKELQKKSSQANIVIHYSFSTITIVAVILAIGFFAKVLNYTINNINELKNTIKK